MGIGLAVLTAGGKKNVASAGTRVQLTSSANHTNLHYLTIQADEDNGADIMFIGDVTVTGDLYVRELAAGEVFEIYSPSGGGAAIGQIDATKIYLDASADNNDVQWGYF